MRYSKLPAVLLAAALLAILPVPALSGAASEPPPGGGKAPESTEPFASVKILSPSPSDVVHGPTRIRVEVDPFGDRKVTQVEIFADGVLIARDPLPPYEALWKAGEDLDSRVIRVVAILSDGTRAEDLITTRGLRFHEQELVEATPLEHVQLLVSVTGPDGKPVSGLDAGSFRVREEGEPVEISKVTPLSKRMDLPLSVAVLIDRSGSMRVHMAKIAHAAVDLLSVLRPVDSVRVACFSDDMHVLQDFTRDPVSLLESLAQVGPAGGGTRLFRAIHDTVRDMRDRPGRKVLVVLTDGLDTEFTSPSSPITVNMYPILTEVARAASRAGVTVVVILPGPTGRGYLAVQDLALQTGGWYAYPGEDFSGTLRRLGERVLGAYVVEFDTKRPNDPDRKRPLEVSLAPGLPKGLEVNAALGTYAGLDLFDALSQDLQDGTPEQRARAASEIELVPGEDAAKALRDALDDKDPGVRAAAATALGERKDPDGMKDVLDLVHDPDPKVRTAAYEAAVRYGAPAVPRLEKESRDRGEAGRDALRALGSIGGVRAAQILTERLTDSKCRVRAAAAGGAGLLLAASSTPELAQPEESKAISSLREALRSRVKDHCEEAAQAATEALGKLSGAPSSPPAPSPSG